MAGASKAISVRDLMFGFCACVNFGLTLTLLISMNALFPDWLTSFDTDRGSATAVQATCLGVTLGAGVIAGMLERKLRKRMSLLLGSVLAAVGLFSGGFARTLPVLIVCVGVVTGCGFCLLHLSTLSTAMQRFPKRAGAMSSAMLVMSGLINLGTPLLYRYLAGLYTWRGSLIVASGIVLQTTVIDLLLTSPLLNTPRTKETELTPCDTLTDNQIHAFQKDAAATEASTLPHANGDTCANENVTGAINYSTGDNFDPQDTTHWAMKECEKESQGDEEMQLISSGPRIDPVKTTPSPDIPDDELISSGALFLQGNSLIQQDKRQTHSGEPERDDDTCRITYDSAREDVRFLHEASEPLDSSRYRYDSANKTEPDQEDRDSSQRKGQVSSWRSNITFLRNPLYICILIATVVPLSTGISFVFLVLDYAVNKGGTVEDGVLLNFVYMLSGLIGRVLIGVVSLHRRVHSTAMLIGCGLIASVGMGLLGQVSSFGLAAFCYGCIAVGYGGIVAMFPAAVLRVTGTGGYSIALGVLCTVEGILDAIAGITTGVLVDLLKSYSLLSLVYGSVSVAANLLLLVVFLCYKPRAGLGVPPQRQEGENAE